MREEAGGGSGGGSGGVSANEHSCAHGAQINFTDLTPYLICELECLHDCQCQSRNNPRFDPGILRHTEIWWAADATVFHKVLFKIPFINQVFDKSKNLLTEISKRAKNVAIFVTL